MFQRRARLVLVLCSMLACSLPVESAKKRAELKEWIDGPIRYISTKEEARAFRKLETDEDRALFTERFWRRRDPSPETLTNEYRQLFWERVQQANANFIDAPKPGWMTDRGKIYILYGPPTETQEDTHLATEGLPASGLGLIRWTYSGRPGQRMDMNPIVVVPFVRDASGEYRLSYDPRLSSVFFDATAITDKRYESLERFFELTGSGWGRSELSVMLDLGRMQEVPPQEQVLLARVETSEAYDTRPLRSSVSRYLHPDHDAPVVALTIDLSDTAGRARPAMVARFEPFDATQETRLLGEDSFHVEEREQTRVAQARIVLEPGDYTLTVLVADPNDVTTSLSRETVRVPPPAGRLRFSDLTWAVALESLPYASLSGYDEPFIVGAFKVLPKLDATFERGERVKLFYEVYAGRAPFQVTYRLEGREDDGSWTPLGQPSTGEQTGTSQAWELATGDRWPLGDYRVRIEVQDDDGRLISTELPFTLQATEPS